MPHNFVRFPADRPNPGRRWRHADVKNVCQEAGNGKLEWLWFDKTEPEKPRYAYALVRDGDGQQLRDRLGGDELIVLHSRND